MSTSTVHTAGNAAIGGGWLATLLSLFAAIQPGEVAEWAKLAQFLAIGGFTLYLTLRKQYEAAHRESLTAKIDAQADEIASLRDELARSLKDREKLAAATGVRLDDTPVPPLAA